ncbi:MAG: c-type cytochrome [Bacteroidota bacterium]
MKKALIFCIPLLTVVLLSAFSLSGNKKRIYMSTADSILADRKHYVDEIMAQIKGKENLPADSVFKNIKILKGVPAGRLLAIMDKGWANSLGVTCGHCHQNGQWELETKPTKDIARKMSAMTATINNQLLKNIEGLRGPNAIINCTSCHRGSTKPALQMPVAAN